jgi:hypothetical protein
MENINQVGADMPLGLFLSLIILFVSGILMEITAKWE